MFKNTASAMKYGACENITVSDCTLISTSAAIKFGTESEALFRNIRVQNCNIKRSNRGISLMLRDSGHIEDVVFSNINIETRMFSKEHWWGEAEPIAITAVKRKPDTAIGSIRNVSFENINCIGENGILLYGDESKNLTDIHFNNINLQLVKKTDWPKNNHDLRPCMMEPAIIEGSLNVIFARNAGDISIDNLMLSIDDEMMEYVKNPYDIENCDSFVVDGEKI